jgi:hypothetical protein
MRMKKKLFAAMVLAAAASGASAQGQPDLALLSGQEVRSGYLYTASFQRADGSTCAWIRVEDGALARVIYDPAGGQCRRVPGEGLDTFEFSGASGDTLRFGGPDMTIVGNTGNMVSANWNHVSRDARFDLQNVVFRFLPDAAE